MRKKTEMDKNVEAGPWRAFKIRLRMFGLDSPLPGQLSDVSEIPSDETSTNSRGCPSGVVWALQL